MKVKNKTCLRSPNWVLSMHKSANASFCQPSEEFKILKLETVDTENLEYVVLDKYAEKKKWMDRYRRAYIGKLAPETGYSFKENSKFIVAIDNEKEIGFLRLVNSKKYFSAVTSEEAWDIADGYVKPAYQSQGVLRAMIENAVTNHHAKSVTLASERIEKCMAYYKALGFTVTSVISECNCYRLYLETWEEILAKVFKREEM
jgi:GNAT superfamily N-acetyltransferase